MSDLAVFIPMMGIGCGVIAVIGGTFVKPYLRYKEKALLAQTEMTAEKAAQYAAHTERLEQRVRVLERILTDQGVETAAQIEALRQEPRGFLSLELDDEQAGVPLDLQATVPTTSALGGSNEPH